MSSRADDAVNALVISVFQLNGVLLAAGDQITAPFEISSARWQVLGALAFNENALTVPRVAAYMGLSRQAVIKQMKLLAADGLVQSQMNAAHKRAELWSLTEAGRSKYEGIMGEQRVLAHQWRKGLTLGEINECARVLNILEKSIKHATDVRGRDSTVTATLAPKE